MFQPTMKERINMISESTKARLTALIDKDYIRQREALIPLATARASKEFGAKPRYDNAANWTRVFFAEMDRLWRAKG